MIHKKGVVLRNSNAWKSLRSIISEKQYSTVYILVDENTEAYCLPTFKEKVNLDIKMELLTIRSGEKHKNIDSCINLWKQLSEKNADRHSLMINLGGGMI